MSSPPSWDTLADRAHHALQSVSALTATIHVFGPRHDDPYGEPVESTLNVWFSGPDLWRIERNGEVIVVREHSRHLERRASGVMQQRLRADTFHPLDELGGLGWTYVGMFHAMSGFERPTEPANAVTVAGRNAWQVVLEAKKGKPYSLTCAFDDITGLLVRYAAVGTGFVTEVTHLRVNWPVPTETFIYDGPVELEGLPVIDVDVADGLWAMVDPSIVDDGEFPQCSVGDTISGDGLLLRVTKLTVVESIQDGPQITLTDRATPHATYTVRGVCRVVVTPMTVRLDVGGLDLAVEPGTFRDVSASGGDEMLEPYSDDFETPEPGQWVEAQGYFEVPWSHEWELWGGEQAGRDWKVFDIWSSRRNTSIGPWAGGIPTGIDPEDPPRVRQWQNVEAFWVKMAPIDR